MTTHENEHPEQEAHGGSMAPGLVDDSGHLVEQDEPAAEDVRVGPDESDQPEAGAAEPTD